LSVTEGRDFPHSCSDDPHGSVTPEKEGYIFDPPYKNITIKGDVTNLDFGAPRIS